MLRAFVVRAGDEHNLNSIDDLRSRTVIVTANTTADDDLRTRLSRAGITTTTILNTTDESTAAREVLNSGDAGEPFAYAGGLGSVQYLASELDGLAVAWPHCNMTAGTIARNGLRLIAVKLAAGYWARRYFVTRLADKPPEGADGAFRR